MAILRNVAKTDTLEVQRQTINLLASDLFGVLGGTSSISAVSLGLSDGTRLNPSLYFTTDDSLGLYKSDAQTVAFVADSQSIARFSSNDVKLNKDFIIERTTLNNAQISVTNPGSDYDAGTYQNVALVGGSGNSALADVVVTKYVGDLTDFNDVNNYNDGVYTNIPLVSNTRFDVTITQSGAGYLNGLSQDLELFNVATGTFVVTTIANPGTPPPNNVYVIDGVTQDPLTMVIGNTYRFDVSDMTNMGHPLNFSDALDQALPSADFVVLRNGTEGNSGAFVDLIIKPSATAQTIKYYCANHAGMGADITVSTGTAGNYGDGVRARVEVAGGAIDSVFITTDGSGYKSGDTLTVVGGTANSVLTLSGGNGSSGTGAIINFDILTIDNATLGIILNAGSDYLPGFYPGVTLTGGNGNGKTADITIDGSIAINNSNNGTSVTNYTPGSYNSTPLFNKATANYNISLVEREEFDFRYGTAYAVTIESLQSNTDWTVSGDFSGLNPTINLVQGDVLTIDLTTEGRAFSITSASPYSSADALSSPELTGGTFPIENGAGVTTLTLDTQHLTPGTYYYYNTLQPTVMFGEIVVSAFSGTDFAVGDTVTGADSGASAVITYIDIPTLKYRVQTISNGPFIIGEIVNNGTTDAYIDTQTTVDVFSFGTTENLELTVGNTYRLDASDPSNANVLPYIVTLGFNTYNNDQLAVITEGTPGSAGSFYDVVVNPSFSDARFQIIPLDPSGASTLNLTRSIATSTSGAVGQYTLDMIGNANVSSQGVIPLFQIVGSTGSNYKVGDVLELSPLRTGGTGFEATISGITYFGYVSQIDIQSVGTGYQDGDILGIDDADVGNVGGSGFQYQLSSSREVDNLEFVSKGINYAKDDLLTLPQTAENISTTVSTGSTQLTVADTTGIYQGFILQKVSGAGDIAAGTTVTNVVDGTTLDISQNPTVDGGIILDFVPPYGGIGSFRFQIEQVGVVESVTLTSDGVGYEPNDILFVNREDLKLTAGPYTFDANLEITVQDVNSDNVIFGDVSAGSLYSNIFTGNSATFTDAEVTNTLTAPDIVGVDAVLSNINSSNNITLTSGINSETTINTSRLNVGTTVDIITDSGNINTPGRVSATSVDVNSVLLLDSDISSSSGNDIILTPATERVVVINTTTGLQIPAGTTAQRPQPGVRDNGSIRFNTQTDQYEGFSAVTGQWSSLGGIRDLDGNTTILAEEFAGANDNTLYFFNDNQNTLRLTPFEMEFRSVKTISSTNLAAPTYNQWNPNTPVNAGDYLRYLNNIYVVATAGTTGDVTNPPVHEIGTEDDGTAQLTWNATAVDELVFDGISQIKLGPNKNTPVRISEEIQIFNDEISSLNLDLKLAPFTGKKVVVDTNTSLQLPFGTTGDRGIPGTGSVRFNTQLTQFEGYNGANWTSLGGVRDVDGNTYIIPETGPGNNENILYFYNDDNNTLQVSTTALTFKTVNTIESDSNNLDINASTIGINNDILTLTTSATETKFATTSNNLEFAVSSGIYNDVVFRATNGGDLQLNTGFGTGTPSYTTLISNDLTSFELRDSNITSQEVSLVKGTNDFGLITVFDPSVHKGAKIALVADNVNTNDREMIEFSVISKGTDIFHTEYGNINTGSGLVEVTFDFDGSNNVRITPTLLSSVTAGNTVNVTAVITIIKK